MSSSEKSATATGSVVGVVVSRTGESCFLSPLWPEEERGKSWLTPSSSRSWLTPSSSRLFPLPRAVPLSLLASAGEVLAAPNFSATEAAYFSCARARLESILPRLVAGDAHFSSAHTGSELAFLPFGAGDPLLLPEVLRPVSNVSGLPSAAIAVGARTGSDWLFPRLMAGELPLFSCARTRLGSSFPRSLARGPLFPRPPDV